MPTKTIIGDNKLRIRKSQKYEQLSKKIRFLLDANFYYIYPLFALAQLYLYVLYRFTSSLVDC